MCFAFDRRGVDETSQSKTQRRPPTPPTKMQGTPANTKQMLAPDAFETGKEKLTVALTARLRAKEDANARLRSEILKLERHLEGSKAAYHDLMKEHEALNREHRRVVAECEKLQETVRILEAKENNRSGRIQELYDLHSRTMTLLGKSSAAM